MAGVSSDRTSIIWGTDKLESGFEHWLIKFPNSYDPPDIARIEFGYSVMAAKAGVEMAESHLFESRKGNCYFGTKRFDRDCEYRHHMHTTCGLLESDFRVPALDYNDLLSACRMLTRNEKEVKKLFRLAVFNVLAHNRDDHSKNFSFLMSDDGTWELAPAYDLTYSSGPGGEQSMLVLGEGKEPTIRHLKELASRHSLPKSFVTGCIEQVTEAVNSWPKIAAALGIKTVIRLNFIT